MARVQEWRIESEQVIPFRVPWVEGGVQVIYDKGTSIDPLALFIQSGMTDCLGAISMGNEGACGIVVIGGLNPTTVFEESGVRVDSRAFGGVLDFSERFPYPELRARLIALTRH